MATATLEAPAAPQPKRRSKRRARIVDAVLAIGLFTIALVYRLHFPPDGLFYDDAWQAFGAAEGTLRQFFTIGQTQPGFGLELIAWTRIFGHDASTMVVPAMIAGALGPAALYLVLRRFGYALSIAFLLGASLAVCETAITYSGRVKSYTTDVLVILLLCVILPWLARKRWTPPIAAAWFVGSVAVASVSSFALLASIAAAAVLVLHARQDRKLRLISVGAQAVAVVGLFRVEQGTYNADLLEDFFKPSQAFIEFHLNPVTLGREIIEHLVRVTDVFPGGPGLVSVVCMITATVGLVAMARHGAKAIVGRFLVLMVLLAIVGTIAQRVPFGPSYSTRRVALWLAPVVAFGLAVVLQRLYRAAVARGRAQRLMFDVVAFGLAAVVLAGPIGAKRVYPAGAARATHTVMAEAGPDDVVIATRPTIYTFALEAGAPVRLTPTPSLTVGFMPKFADKRLHVIGFLTGGVKREIETALKKTDRVFVVHSLADEVGYRPYEKGLANLIKAQGFERQPHRVIGTARVSVWEHAGTEQAAG